MKKQLKKGLIIGLSITTILGCSAFIGVSLRNKVKADTPSINDDVINDDSTITNKGDDYTIRENGIKIVERASSQEGAYGTRTFTYTVDPNVNNDTITLSLTDSSGNSVEYNTSDSILTITHTFSSQTITVTCNKVFTKQLIIRLSSTLDPNVTASVTLDFVEKLTCTPSLTASDKLKGTVAVQTTGGTKAVDKTIKNEKYTFEDSFVNSLNTTFDRSATDYEERSGNHSGYSVYVKNVKIYGLDDAHITTLKSKIDHNAFIKTIYATYTCVETDEEGDDSYTNDGKLYLYQISNTSFQNLFNGTTPVFKYSASVNNVSYTSTCGLLINNIKASSITPNLNGIEF